MNLASIKAACVALATLFGSMAPLQPGTAPQVRCVTVSGYRVCLRAQTAPPAAPGQPASKPQPVPKPPETTPAPKPQPPATDTQTSAGLTALEQQMLNLVNAERAKAGLAPLKADPTLTKLARMKSQDMIDKGYFGHNSPTYGSPFEMMQRFGVTYRTAGENLAGNPSVQGAHTSLMNSPGHRANILNPNFTNVGIGIIQGGPYGLMITQLFTG
ncbi:MAG: CAP domain-containing protein [Firmicutes bacterium]|nr:CAP domain-containing protein [Bacillota bacterium]